MSPEQTGRMNRAVDYRTDFYSLGVTFYELLTGAAALPRRRTRWSWCTPHRAGAGAAARAGARRCRASLSAIVHEAAGQDAPRSATRAPRRSRPTWSGAWSGWQADGTHRGLPAGPARRLRTASSSPSGSTAASARCEALLAAFERVAQGGSRSCCWWRATRASASPRWCTSCTSPIVAQRGFFVSGKFDQLQRDIPYATLIQAFGAGAAAPDRERASELAALARAAAARPGRQRPGHRRPRPRAGARSSARSRPCPSCRPPRRRTASTCVFQRFLRVFATAEHPLVLFLDDLQWADAAVAQAARAVAHRRRTTQHLLLIGAYRDNEVSRRTRCCSPGGAAQGGRGGRDAHPRAARRWSTSRAGGRHAAVRREEARPLAELVLRKTGATPSSSASSCCSLHERGAACASTRSAGRWRGTSTASSPVEHHRQRGGADGGQDPQAARAARSTCCSWRRASATPSICARSRCSSMAPLEAAGALWPALQEGLVLPLDAAYKFFGRQPRDEQRPRARLRGGQLSLPARPRAAGRLRLIPPEHRAALHLQVGRLLLRSAGEEEREERSCWSATSTCGAELIEARAERDELAALNLAAGRKPRPPPPTRPPSLFSGRGSRCWGRTASGAGASWRSPSTSRRPRGATSTRRSTGSISTLARARHDGDLLLRVKVAELRIQASNCRTSWGTLAALALEILEVLGVHFPEQPTQADFLASVSELDAVLAGRPIASPVGAACL